MAKNRQALQHGNEEESVTDILDPIDAMFGEGESMTMNVDIHNATEEQNLGKDLNRAYRDYFNEAINILQKEFNRQLFVRNNKSREGGLGQDPSYDYGSEFHKLWYQPLNGAVKNGTPADFSNDHANRVYAASLLEPRVRYLHHIVMDHNPISKKVRNLLLPQKCYSNDYDDDCDDDDNNGVTVICSIGGGPGYDHVACYIVATFLHQIQSAPSCKSRKVCTHIFDLFDQDWKSIMELLDYSIESTVSRISKELKSNKKDRIKATTKSAMTMHYCDVRLSIDDVANRELNNMLPTADIICFQYVLHENSSSLFPGLNNGTHDIVGVLHDILTRAKVGTLLICTDSNNFVWPHLKKIATFHGWIFLSDTEKSISFGPTSFVLFERKSSDKVTL